jgi:acetyl-CoA carboxylase carboxyltransferase component
MTAQRRRQMGSAAVAAARAVGYVNAGTVEFIADESGEFYFMEMNTRLQVEHPVTEMITGLDLVEWQLRVAAGQALPLTQDQVAINGHAIEARVYAEDPARDFLPAAGRIAHLRQPQTSAHVRIDTGVREGDEIGVHYDPMIAKLICWDVDREAALRRLRAALSEYQVVGLATNIAFLSSVAAHRAFALAHREPGLLDTGLIARYRGELIPESRPASDEVLAVAVLSELMRIDQEAAAAASASGDPFSPWHLRDGWRMNEDNHHTFTFVDGGAEVPVTAHYRAEGYQLDLPGGARVARAEAGSGGSLVVDMGGARLHAQVVRTGLTLTVFTGGASHRLELKQFELVADEEAGGSLVAPMPGNIVAVLVSNGQRVEKNQPLLVMEAMKMEHVIASTASGIVRAVTVAKGDTVYENHSLAFIEEAEVAADTGAGEQAIDLDAIRPDLAEVLARQAKTQDAARPDAVARRRKTGQRTMRENIERLCDPGSFVEYGGLVIAARRQRNTIDELINTTPADGLVTGLGRINGETFPDRDSRAVVMHYDYTVLAGTQGKKNHAKKDRMFEIAREWRLPVVFFTEGGGGRPGDTDVVSAANLITPAFHLFGRLSGLVPLVGVTSGRCFAGNAVMLGCCDVVIATRNSTIGMGGPAMIEGGGLGVFRPEEVGPLPVMTRNGVVDIAVEDEDAAVDAAKKYLSYFQGPLPSWTCGDQRLLRHAIPENRVRVYDIRQVIETLADAGSVLELRRDFGVGMITAFIRIEGRPLGLIANNPKHLGGAIDSEAADKAARFMQLCDAFDLPILSLCDTPGNMVGPEHEKTGLVRHCCRPFVIGANLTVPLFVVVLRKAYGLGAQGMAGGGFHAPFFAVAWPTGEFGGMGLEGAVKLGYRNELAAIADPDERRQTYERMVAAMYERGKALNTATLFELDDVIDPADTRRWVMAGLRSAPPPAPRTGKKHAWIDTW